jgi:hypothetical protein
VSEKLRWHNLRGRDNREVWQLGGYCNLASVYRTGNGYVVQWNYVAEIRISHIDWMKVEDMKRYVEAQYLLRQ